MTPADVATFVAAAQSAVKDGKTGVVSNPTGSSPASSPFQALLNGFAGAGKAALDLATKVFNPGTAQADATVIASSVAKGITGASDAGINAVKKVTNSVSSGVETGFKYGTLIIIVIAGLWVYSKVK